MDVRAAATPASPSAEEQPRGRIARLLSLRAAHVCVALLLLAGGGAFFTQLGQEVAATPSADGHHDFLAFQAAAQLVSHGNAAGLYDTAAISALERQVIATPVGAAGYMPYLSPPFGAAVQAPFGLLSEPSARIIWLLINLPLALACCWLGTTGLALRTRLLAAACLVGTFPFFQALVEGQWSFVMLAGCLGALWAARTNRPAWAGAGLAVLALKPPLLIPVLVVLLVLRAWRTVLACVGVVLAVLLVTLPFTGLSAQLDYAGYLLAVVGSHLDGAGAAGAAVWHGGINGMEGINGLVAGYVGQQNVVVLDGLTALGVAAVVARWVWVAARGGVTLAHLRGRWTVIAGIAAALLTDLHLYPQDCVLVLVALPLLTGMVRPALRLPLVLGVAVFMDSAWLDQLAVTPHVFTWLLAIGFLWSGARALGVQPGRWALTAMRRRASRTIAATTVLGFVALPWTAPATVAHAAALPFRVGAASQSYAPPAFGASLAPFMTSDPADCLPPGNTVYTGPRQFAFEEPYVDQNSSGHYDLGDPFLDCNHDGRWDGNYIGGGGNAPRYYSKVADAPSAQAIAVSNGTATIVIEVLDHEGLFNIYQAEIRARVGADLAAKRLAAPDNIFISSTHDESAPDSIGLYGPNAVSSSVNQYWTEDWLVPNAALAIENAMAAMQPANLRFAEPVQPANLRQCFSSYPFIDDQLMPSFQAVAADGHVIATLADISQHSETLGFDSGTQADPAAPPGMGTVTLDQEATWLSADWQHWFRTKLEADYAGSVTVEMAGNVGSNETPQVFSQPLSRTPEKFVDASHPAGCRTLYNAHGSEVPLGYYSETRTLGQQLAAAVEGGFPANSEPPFSTSTIIRGARTDVCVEVTNALFQAAGAAGVFGSRPVYTQNCSVMVPVGPNGSTEGTELLTEVAAFQVGDGSFISVPGEIFPFTFLRGFVGPQDMPFSQFALPQWPLPHMHTPYRFIDGLGEDMSGYIFPQGNGVGVPGEYPTTNPQANSTDRFGCGHSDDSESAGSGAADSLANALVPLMDSTFGGASEDIVQGRYILPGGTLSRDPLGGPEVKCTVDMTFAPTGAAVGVWRSDGTIIQPAHWMSLSGRAQDVPDRNTRGWIDAAGTRHWLDVFADIAGAPAAVAPPAGVPDAPFAPLLLVVGVAVIVFVVLRARRRGGPRP